MQRVVAAREHEQPGRVAVEPVHDARALGVRPAGDAARERLHERALARALARVDDDARRLVDHEQVLVLVGDREARRLDRRGSARARGASTLTISPPESTWRLGFGHAVDAHQPGVDQPLRLRARAGARGEEDVEPLARGLAPGPAARVT